MNADRRWEREKVLQDFCEEHGLEHSTSCYEAQVNNENRETFWVCTRWCPTLLAKTAAKRLKLGGGK